MSFDPIKHDGDSRVTYNTAKVGDKTYFYVEGLPEGTPKATVLCVHGFPDLWYGWREIIPFLQKEGLRVIVPDMIGYGGTSDPIGSQHYTLKSIADDIAELLRVLNIPRVILLGHDWGGAAVGRIYLHHPNIVTHIASFCTPYPAVTPAYYPAEVIADQEATKTLTYQVGLIQPDTETGLKEKEAISKFLRAIIRLRFDDPKLQVREHILESLGDQALDTAMLSKEDMDYYIEKFYGKEHKFHGPLNWYKTRLQNFEDEKKFIGKDFIYIPYLFIGGDKDTVLIPAMWPGQRAHLLNLTERSVPAGHWPMSEDPQGCYKHLKEWFDGVVFGDKLSLPPLVQE